MNKEFEVHKIDEIDMLRLHCISAAFDGLLDFLTFHVPEGRELSIVKTKLEEACFFAKKGSASFSNRLIEGQQNE